jgi:hypothetical protein
MTGRFHAGTFEAGGIAFTVETNDADWADRFGEVFRDLRVADGAPFPVVFEVLHQGSAATTHPWAVWRDGEPLEMTVADHYILAYLLWEISHLMFERTGERVHIHGAALVRNEQAVVLAGRSHAGKSTLAGWLTYRGWGFLTDEAALVDPDALIVAPFWRPIGVRRPGPLDRILGDAVPEEDEVLVPASTIGRLAPATPLTAMVFPALSPNEPAALVPLSPAAALMELTRHFPGLIAGGRAGFRRLARLVTEVPGYMLRFHDLDDAERVLRELMSLPS